MQMWEDNEMKKRLLSITLALCMVISAMPATAEAAPEACAHICGEACCQTVLTCRLEQTEGHPHTDTCYESV